MTLINLTKILAPFKGKWVTLTRDEKTVLGSGDTMDQALNEATHKGESNPFLIKVPDLADISFFFWSKPAKFLILRTNPE